MKTATCPRTYRALAVDLDAAQRDLGLLRYDDTNASQSSRLGEAQHLVVRARALVLSVEGEPSLDPCTCFTGLCTACLTRVLQSTEETPYPHSGACPYPKTHGSIGRNALGKFDRTFGGPASCPWCGWKENARTDTPL
jgi:hypothetical protein